jgi:hypothetical protein
MALAKEDLLLPCLQWPLSQVLKGGGGSGGSDGGSDGERGGVIERGGVMERGGGVMERGRSDGGRGSNGEGGNGGAGPSLSIVGAHHPGSGLLLLAMCARHSLMGVMFSVGAHCGIVCGCWVVICEC